MPVRPNPLCTSSQMSSAPCSCSSLRRRGQEAVRRHVHALALDRLDDERRDVALLQLGLQRVEVAEAGSQVSGSSGSKPLAELGRAVDGQRAGGQPVEGVVAVDDAAATGGVAGELQRGLDRLGAAVAEEHPVQARGLGEQPLRPAARAAGRSRTGSSRPAGRRARRAAPGGSPGGCGPPRTRRSRTGSRRTGCRRRRTGTRPRPARRPCRSRSRAAPSDAAGSGTGRTARSRRGGGRRAGPAGRSPWFILPRPRAALSVAASGCPTRASDLRCSPRGR